MNPSKHYGIGGSPNSIDDDELLKGKRTFVSDIYLPRMVHAEFVRSVHAHAKIINVDCTQAKEMKGVLAILTGQDASKDNLGSIKPFAVLKRRDGSDMYIPKNLPITLDKVVFVGDIVAVVVAETKNQALNASEAITVEYEELDAVVSIDKASQPDASIVWPENGSNECFFWSKGESKEAMSEIKNSEHSVSSLFNIPLAGANPIEPRGCVASYDNQLDCYHLSAPVQSPWKVRQIIASQSLKIPEEKLSVSCPDIGGSFGMKGQTYNEYVVCLWAAKKLERPIKWVASRTESFLSDDQGRNVRVDGSLSFNSDGKFSGLYVSGLCGLGAYLSTRGTKTSVDNWPGVSGVYKIKSVYVEMKGIFTNTASVSPYRGAGRPEAAYVIERLVDLAAEKLNISQTEIRKINFVKTQEMPYLNNLGFLYDSGDYLASLEQAMRIANWSGFETRRNDSRRYNLLRGIGVACVVERSMSGQPEYASVRLTQDGNLILSCGAISFGQGSSTIFPQILREKLQMDDIEVTYVSGTTKLIPKGTGSFGSRSAGLCGAAVARVAQKLINEIKKRAALLLQEDYEALTYSRGYFESRSGGTIHFNTLAKEAEIFCEAEYKTDESTFPSGAHISEVEVDPETGKIFLQSYCAVEDTGVVINPVRLDGQMHGGITQGAAQILMERVIYDEASGQLLTGSFMDYPMPRASDMPFFAIGHNSIASPVNPLGVKGGGEGGTVGGLVCVANAIANAFQGKGLPEIPIPATSVSIWGLLKDHYETS